MKNNRITFIFAFMLTACASVPRGLQKVDSGDTSPKDILEDYTAPSSAHLFPANLASVIEKNPEKAKDIICSAKGPNLNLTLNVKVIPPKPAPNQPLDIASKARSEFLENVRDFLRYRFFMALAKTPKAPVTERNERNQYDVPIIRDPSEAGVESFYKSLRYQPSFYEKRWLGGYGGNAKMDVHFFVFIFPHKRVLLTPKVSEFGLVTLDRNHKATIQQTDLATLAEGNQSLPVLNIAQNSALHEQVAVVPSPSSWQEADKAKFHTLRFAKTDIGALMDAYTFALPRAVVESRFKAKNANAQLAYGLDFDTHKPIASKMIEQRSFIWENVVREATQIKEHQESDQVLYEIALDLTDFCSYGVGIENLRSK